ncbi:hypothetical protein DdX_16511 [Ditylenchus destructor]|uniref:Uncharacterized protein n=1 Tax=Ditylenchus destructor TaxID=166010 RepID=A0AAD4MNV5_9BILA|nr:hypothetical protein DdX_16511 [Ditylenchus destructor]
MAKLDRIRLCFSTHLCSENCAADTLNESENGMVVVHLCARVLQDGHMNATSMPSRGLVIHCEYMKGFPKVIPNGPFYSCNLTVRRIDMFAAFLTAKINQSNHLLLFVA